MIEASEGDGVNRCIQIYMFQLVATLESRHFDMINGSRDINLFKFFTAEESPFLDILDGIWNGIYSSHFYSWESV
jgi:hypothetical protein